MAITFDPAAKRIVLDSASVSATELFSRWMDWSVLSDNVKYGEVLRQVGGEDLGGGLSIPPYFFLQNGWRVRPMEMAHNLVITGNLFVAEGGVPVVSTLGVFQVNVNYTVPVQAQGVSTSGSTGPTAAEIAAAVWQQAARTLTSGGGSGGATPEEIWTYINRTLTSGSSLAPTALENAAAIRESLAGELAMLDVAISTRIATGTVVKANVLAIKDQTVLGDGTKDSPWRPA